MKECSLYFFSRYRMTRPLASYSASIGTARHNWERISVVGVMTAATKARRTAYFLLADSAAEETISIFARMKSMRGRLKIRPKGRTRARIKSG